MTSSRRSFLQLLGLGTVAASVPVAAVAAQPMAAPVILREKALVSFPGSPCFVEDGGVVIRFTEKTAKRMQVIR